MRRTSARIAALAITSAAVLTLAAGTASAGGDDRCKNAEGVVVACTPIDVGGIGVAVDALTHVLDGHHHH